MNNTTQKSALLGLALVAPLATGHAEQARTNAPPQAASKVKLVAQAPKTNKPASKPARKAPVVRSETFRVGQAQVFDFDGMTTTAVGDPTVADIVPISTRRLLVSAKGPGQTTVYVFDRRGKNTLDLTVTPATKQEMSADLIQSQIGVPTVTARLVSDTVFLEGTVDSQPVAQRAEAIAGAHAAKVKNLLVVSQATGTTTIADKYAALLSENLTGSGVAVRVVDEKTIALTGKYITPIVPATSKLAAPRDERYTERETKDPLERLLASLPADLKVINLVNFQRHAARQILVKAKVIDINRGAMKNFGLNWGSINFSGSTPQQRVGAFSPQPILFEQIGRGLKLREFLPFGAQLNALITENKARVLSQPSLVVLDGNEGVILVGGEIPIPVAQNSSGGSPTISVEYKQFGIRLAVNPMIVEDGVIQMTVTPEVSDLDFSRAVQFNGFVIPAIATRRATSTLQMRDGETLVIGGLYSNQTTRQVQKIPLLSQIPILGEFFKNTVTNKTESELVILIETTIVQPGTPGTKAAAPGSLQNPGIERPVVNRHELEKDFPELTPVPGNQKKKPLPPINLPETAPATERP